MRKCAASLMHQADTAFPQSSCRRTPTRFLRSPRPRSWRRQYPFRRLRKIQRRRMPKPMAAVAHVPRERNRTRMAGAGAGQTLSTGIGSGHRSVNSRPQPAPFLGRHQCMVRAKGLEPPRLASLEPKSSASTNSATPASLGGFETPAENGTDSKVSQAVCNSAVTASLLFTP